MMKNEKKMKEELKMKREEAGGDEKTSRLKKIDKNDKNCEKRNEK